MSPTPSRSSSPLPDFYPEFSDDDDDSEVPIYRYPRWWPERRPPWWSGRHHRHGWRVTRSVKRWFRRVAHHPLFPAQPVTIVLTLILFSVFAISLTLLLIYILNPDKEPLPWRAYCSTPSIAPPFDRPAPLGSPHIFPNLTHGEEIPPFPPPHLDTLPPAGIFLGVFSIDSGFERRMLVRSTWASHPRSRHGAGPGDDGLGTSRTIVRFVLGQPRKDFERRIKLEMETYNDLIILPMAENMNGGKTHTFFSWAAINAWVPPVYKSSVVPPPAFSYVNATAPPPSLATHDPFLAWEDINTGKSTPWVRPDYVAKVDDDAFVMLAEFEARLRVELHENPLKNKKSVPTPSNTRLSKSPSSSVSPPPASELDPLIYWGYLVTNRLHQFMAGELYALSWSIVEWVAKDPTVKTLTRGAEDKQTSKWMRIHPRADEIRWTTDHCWIYDHPRSGTVYGHGFLFPSEVTRVKRSMATILENMQQATIGAHGTTTTVISPVNSLLGSTPAAWAHSSVSTFGVRYTPPLPDLSTLHSVEAMVEGSDMSMLREGNPMTPAYAWEHREGRKARYEGKRVGGTVVVHFIKKHMWYLETAMALLDGEEMSEAEQYEMGRAAPLIPGVAGAGVQPPSGSLPSAEVQAQPHHSAADKENDAPPSTPSHPDSSTTTPTDFEDDEEDPPTFITVTDPDS